MFWKRLDDDNVLEEIGYLIELLNFFFVVVLYL